MLFAIFKLLAFSLFSNYYNLNNQSNYHDQLFFFASSDVKTGTNDTTDLTENIDRIIFSRSWTTEPTGTTDLFS